MMITTDVVQPLLTEWLDALRIKANAGGYSGDIVEDCGSVEWGAFYFDGYTVEEALHEIGGLCSKFDTWGGYEYRR